MMRDFVIPAVLLPTVLATTLYIPPQYSSTSYDNYYSSNKNSKPLSNSFKPIQNTGSFKPVTQGKLENSFGDSYFNPYAIKSTSAPSYRGWPSSGSEYSNQRFFFGDYYYDDYGDYSSQNFDFYDDSYPERQSSSNTNTGVLGAMSQLAGDAAMFAIAALGSIILAGTVYGMATVNTNAVPLNVIGIGGNCNLSFYEVFDGRR